MKYLSSILLAATMASTLVACGGGGGGATDTTQPVVNFAQGNETARIDRTDEYSVLIPSVGNSITIAANNRLTEVDITGSNNSFVAEDGVGIGLLGLRGANNRVRLGKDTVPEFDITGTNASVLIGAEASVGRLFVAGGNALITIAAPSAVVPSIRLTGSNITLIVPAGYRDHTVITDDGANNQVVEQ